MISLIVACSKNGVIGNNGKIPWKIEGEQRRFLDLTVNNIVIMGRKTYEEIGHPLLNRFTYVISTTKKFRSTYVETVDSLDKALENAKKFYPEKEIFIVGGSSLYEKALEMDIIDRMYVTIIDKVVAGDRFFPLFDYDKRFILEFDNSYKPSSEYTYYTYYRCKRVEDIERIMS